MKSRLRRVLAEQGESIGIPFGIVFKDYQDKIVNKDRITNVTYGPSISREWLSDEPIDNPEWALQQNLGKNS